MFSALVNCYLRSPNVPPVYVSQSVSLDFGVSIPVITQIKWVAIYNHDSPHAQSYKIGMAPMCKDVYKTLTPAPWTTPMDPVHEPLHGPGPWTTPVDHPSSYNQKIL